MINSPIRKEVNQPEGVEEKGDVIDADPPIHPEDPEEEQQPREVGKIITSIASNVTFVHLSRCPKGCGISACLFFWVAAQNLEEEFFFDSYLL